MANLYDKIKTVKQYPWLLFIIILLALCLRTINVRENPPAAYGDEISFAWNAYSILKTGADEYGVRYPLQFRAFDDYKAPIPVYLLVPVIKLLGLNTFAVRLPVALFGTASVLILYLLVKKLINTQIALISAFLLTISPWHLHLSRGFFESTIAVFFFMAALYFFISAKDKRFYLLYSALFFVLTIYTYFTPRIILLLFIPFLFWWGKEWILKKRKYVICFWLILVICSLPLLKASFFDKGLSRIDKLYKSRDEKIIQEITNTRNSTHSPLFVQKILHNRLIYWLRDVTNDYLEHFSVNFLYLYGDSSLRYAVGNRGMFYLIELPFLLLGVYVSIKNYRKISRLLFGWMLIAPIPAAIVGRPFAVRSLAMVPVPLIFTAIGINYIWNIVKVDKSKQRLIRLLIVIGFTLSFGIYLVRYHLEYPNYAATWWGWENKAAIDLALKEQNHYDQIFLSNFYSGIDLAFAYYTRYDPLLYREAKANHVMLSDQREQIKLGKFYIGSLDIDEKRLKEKFIPQKTLYIGRPEEADSNEVIRAPDDGRILFKIYRTN